MYKYFFSLSQNDSRSFFILIPVVFFIKKKIKEMKEEEKNYVFKSTGVLKEELLKEAVLIVQKDIFMVSF